MTYLRFLLVLCLVIVAGCSPEPVPYDIAPGYVTTASPLFNSIQYVAEEWDAREDLAPLHTLETLSLDRVRIYAATEQEWLTHTQYCPYMEDGCRPDCMAERGVCRTSTVILENTAIIYLSPNEPVEGYENVVAHEALHIVSGYKGMDFDEVHAHPNTALWGAEGVLANVEMRLWLD